MSIPLDRLYHYIESVAEDVHGDDILIYRFYPHGSKNLDDLNCLSFPENSAKHESAPQVYCNDQEPLDYSMYEGRDTPNTQIEKMIVDAGFSLPDLNLRKQSLTNLYDRALILHSERRSSNLERYSANGFIPVYYWSHAVISLDWFRYAQHVTQKKRVRKTFLIYNRAWSGTREYRLAFADRVIRQGIVDQCQMTCNPVDSELDKHYDLHYFEHKHWRPCNVIEDYFPITNATSGYSADFTIEDYESTDIEVVLETLFDDQRWHLTEKTLRPIALGQPFILAGTPGSLKYLREYGFKTFADCWDESYDMMTDSQERLSKIIETMQKISSWTPEEKINKMTQARKIAEYNRQHFFSKEFIQQVENELRTNLTTALGELEVTNTSQAFIERRKQYAQNTKLKNILTGTNIHPDDARTRQDVVQVLAKAQSYYIRSLKHTT
jgi:hypothetical protein